MSKFGPESINNTPIYIYSFMRVSQLFYYFMGFGINVLFCSCGAAPHIVAYQ